MVFAQPCKHALRIALALYAVLLLTGGTLAQTIEQTVEQSVSELNAVGVEAHGVGDLPRAIEAFKEAHGLDPENQTVRFNLSNSYLTYANEFATRREYSAAVDYVKLAMEADTQNAMPLVQLGAYYIHLGHVTEAVFRLEEAIELDPKNVDAHYLLGEAYYKDNDVSAALDQWEWVYNVEPNRDGLADRIETAIREEKVETDFKGQTSRNFSITYTRDLELREVRRILSILESAFIDIGRAIGSNAYPPTPILVTLYSAEGFSETTQMAGHVGALYDGTKIRCPAFDKTGTLLATDELTRRLYHEYVHVVVRHIAKDNVPWWLNEGLAEELSHTMTDTELAFLRQAKANDALYALSDISEDQLKNLDSVQLNVAYREAHAAVAVLKQRFGTRKIGVLLQALANGEDPEVALRKSYRLSYKTLELAISNYIEKG